MIYPFRQVLGSLRMSFVDGGLVALHDTHAAAKQESRAFRSLSALVDLIFPITPLLRLAKALDEETGEIGIHDACIHALRQLQLSLRVDLPARGVETIREKPIVLYGAHGSIFTPVIVAAAVDRQDVRVVALSYLKRLGPNLEKFFLPVYASSSLSLRRAGRRGLLPRLAGWALGKLEAPIDRDEARERNRATLIHASSFARDGGAVLISPEPRPPETTWRRGVGTLVSEVVRGGADDTPYLVPFRIHAASITGAFQLVSRNPLLRALGRHHFRGPIRIVLGEPTRMADVVERVGHDPLRITAYLESAYQAFGHEGARREL